MTVTAARIAQGVMTQSRNGRTLDCHGCRAVIPVDTPVYRTPQSMLYFGDSMAWAQNWCARCVAASGETAPPAAPCVWCARPVGYFRTHGRKPTRWVCSNACYAAYGRHKRRERRRYVCACGVAFTPARSDAAHCSNACRQKAYRARKGGAA